MGCWWPTSEHYFQAQKFAGSRHADLVRRARTPLRAAELGRDPSKPLRRDWERVKDDVMRRAVAAKFGAHADIRDILLATGDQEIVEDTTTDHYRGRGRTGTGPSNGRPDTDAHPYPAPRYRRRRPGTWVRVDEGGNMTNPFEDLDGKYLVVCNDEGQHSLWPTFAEIPTGWSVVRPEGTREECFDYVTEHWIVTA